MQPLKRHGGKHYLAKQIISLFRPHTHYVETHFGGGQVLLQKPFEWYDGVSEVVNDLDRGLMMFWSVLRDESLFMKLQRYLEATPFSQVEWQRAKQLCDLAAFRPTSDTGKLRLAAEFFICCRQSRQGLCKDFATLSRRRTRRGMNEQVSSWLSAIEGLPEVHERLKRVAILNDDAVKVIRREDSPGTLFYVDPPYLHETRVTTGDYLHEMTVEQHERLLGALAKIQGGFILSGYHSSLYDELAKKMGWYVVEIEIDNKASSKKKKEKKTECLWMNYEPSNSSNKSLSCAPS